MTVLVIGLCKTLCQLKQSFFFRFFLSPLLKSKRETENPFQSTYRNKYICESKSILYSLEIRIDVLSEADVCMHFVRYLLKRLHFLTVRKHFSVNKLNGMSTIWVDVKWFDIELSWKAILTMTIDKKTEADDACLKSSSLFRFFNGKTPCDVLHTKWRQNIWNSIETWISNSILIWS